MLRKWHRRLRIRGLRIKGLKGYWSLDNRAMRKGHGAWSRKQNDGGDWKPDELGRGVGWPFGLTILEG